MHCAANVTVDRFQCKRARGCSLETCFNRTTCPRWYCIGLVDGTYWHGWAGRISYHAFATSFRLTLPQSRPHHLITQVVTQLRNPCVLWGVSATDTCLPRNVSAKPLTHPVEQLESLCVYPPHGLQSIHARTDAI